MSDDEMIAVIQAHKKGKEIEYTYKHPTTEVWLSMQSPQFFNFADCIYRVKPEPREFMLLRKGPGNSVTHYDLRFGRPYEEEPGVIEYIKVREVSE